MKSSIYTFIGLSKVPTQTIKLLSLSLKNLIFEKCFIIGQIGVSKELSLFYFYVYLAWILRKDIASFTFHKEIYYNWMEGKLMN